MKNIECENNILNTNVYFDKNVKSLRSWNCEKKPIVDFAEIMFYRFYVIF